MEATEPRTGGLEGLFEGIYRRFRSRPAIFFTLVATLSWAAAALVTLAFASLGTLYLGYDAAAFAQITIVAEAVVAGGVVAGLITSGRTLRLVARWMRGSADRPAPVEAWRAAVVLPYRWATRSILAIAILHLFITAPYVASEAGLPPLGLVAVIGAAEIGVLFGWSLVAFGNELSLRPIVEEIAVDLPENVERETSGWPLRRRAFVSIPIAVATGALFGGAVVSAFDTPSARLAAAAAAGLLFAFVLGVLYRVAVVGPLLRPVADLTAGADRVAAGELGREIPVTSGDELGQLALAFNGMQRGLRERQRLSGENVRLEEKVREQLEEVLASRARIIAASDAERRRVERNLHDGAQQRLVALALELRLLEREAGKVSEQVRGGIARANENLSEALAELKELARGLHPQILTTDGLRPAIRQLAARAPVPVDVHAADERYPEAVESTAYFVVSEALANVAKYSRASSARVSVERRDGRLEVEIADDGAGGADPGAGSGLSGLADRVAALDGALSVESPRGKGTTVRAELPLAPPVTVRGGTP